MDKHVSVSSIFVTDMQLNSLIQEKYIQYTPLRNKIVSLIKDIDSSLLLVNTYIYSFFQFLQLHQFIINISDTTIIELQGNIHNIGLKIITDIELDKTFLTYIIESTLFNITYFQFNSHIYINNDYIDAMNEHIILRSFNTFHQNDDIVKQHLYNIIIYHTQHIVYDNLILIGGEMYGLHKLIESNNLYCYSDYDDIVTCTYKNITNSYDYIECKKIIYDNLEFSDIIKGTKCIICNNGKNGLDIKLSKQINKMKSDVLIIISCNRKSFLTDYETIKDIYDLKNRTQINNIDIYYFILKYYYK